MCVYIKGQTKQNTIYKKKKKTKQFSDMKSHDNQDESL